MFKKANVHIFHKYTKQKETFWNGHGYCFCILRILHGGAKIWILFSSGKTIFYERAQQVSKILFLPRENKIHIFLSRCVMFFLLYRQKDIHSIKYYRENTEIMSPINSRVRL